MARAAADPQRCDDATTARELHASLARLDTGIDALIAERDRYKRCFQALKEAALFVLADDNAGFCRLTVGRRELIVNALDLEEAAC